MLRAEFLTAVKCAYETPALYYQSSIGKGEIFKPYDATLFDEQIEIKEYQGITKELSNPTNENIINL